jgi:hypothetical protein
MPSPAKPPDPSIERSANGMPPGPVRGALHSPKPGPGVLPLRPAQLEHQAAHGEPQRLLVAQSEYTSLRMMHYLISFPSSAMSHIPDEEFPAVSDSAHAVIRQAKAAGVYVFGGGIDESVAPVMIAADGKVSPETYAETSKLNGGFCVLKVPTREEAERWAAKIAAGCRCAQELRQFMYDAES